MLRLHLLFTILFFVGGATLLALHWEDQFTSIGLERRYFAEWIEDREADYLAGLRDTHLGCKTLSYRNPEVLFIGDSHTYSGWDYSVLQHDLPLTVGSCALAGAYPENVCDVLDAIKANGLSTRYLILGISPRMLWDLPDRQDEVRRARLEIASISSPKENFVTLANGKWRKVDRFAGAEAKIQDALASLQAGLETIDPLRMECLLDRYPAEFHATKFWLKYISEGRPFVGLDAIIEQIGNKATASGIQIGVVYIPESQWLFGRYTEDQRQHFLRVSRAFERIASWHNIEWFRRGGADNRHFVNRGMLPDYPYHVWSDIGACRNWIAQDEPTRRWQLFDPDHMNVLGAQRFTLSVTNSLQDWIQRHERDASNAEEPGGHVVTDYKSPP